MKKNISNSLAIFETYKIRRIYDEQKEIWYFSVIDIIAALTDQTNFKRAKSYWTTLKNRLKNEGSELVTKCDQLKMLSADGKYYTGVLGSGIVITKGDNKEFTIYGDDYPTPDGTCVRDYIHVLDLAQAHVLALKALENGAKTTVYNAGVGQGYSNLEIVKMIKKISGIDFLVKFGDRRSGDAAALYASPEKIKKKLRFEPKYSGLETIIKTAWNWHKNNPNGFGDK